MELTLLNLPEDPINLAVDDLIEQLSSIVDTDGNPCLVSVQRGLYMGDPKSGFAEGIIPPKDAMPACRIWDVSQTGEVSATDFFAPAWETVVSLYLYYYSYDGKDLQRQRNNHCRYLLNRLQVPNGDEDAWTDSRAAASGSGAILTPRGILSPNDALWWFTNGSTVDISHVNVFKGIDREVTLGRNWYASKIDLSITTQRSDPETDA